MRNFLKNFVLLLGIIVIFYLPSQVFAYCGDHKLDPGEMCDGGEGCLPNCTRAVHATVSVPVCGNGKLETGEECDGTAGCLPNCKWWTSGAESHCGNGIVEPGEMCDGGEHCLPDCQLAVSANAYICGNGQKEPGEECDDGNLNDGDGCNKNCQKESLPSLPIKVVDVFVKVNDQNSDPTPEDPQDSPGTPSPSSDSAQNTPSNTSPSSSGTSTALPNSVNAGNASFASGCSMMSGAPSRGTFNSIACLIFGWLPLASRRLHRKK